MEPHKNQGGGGGDNSGVKVKLMVSYGGKIQPRTHDHQLTYAGGETKILTVDRTIKFLDIVAKVNSLCNMNSQFRLKYQLPGEDLDALVSLINEDDVENMMFEYDRIHLISTKPARLRLFLFPPIQCATPSALVNPDFLFGFDKEYDPNSAPNLEMPQFPGEGEFGSGQEKRVEAEIQGMTETESCDNKVTSGPSYAYAAAAPLIYWVPVTAGAHQSGLGPYVGMQRLGGDLGNRGQPVYNFLPVMPPFQEQKIISGVHMGAGNIAPTTAPTTGDIKVGTQV